MEFTYSLAMIAFNNITFKHSNKTAFCIFFLCKWIGSVAGRETAHD